MRIRSGEDHKISMISYFSIKQENGTFLFLSISNCELQQE